MFLTTLFYIILALMGPTFGALDFLSLPSTNTQRNLLLTFTPNPNSIIRSISSDRSFTSRGEKITQMVSQLQANAQTSQQSVHDFLSRKNIPFTPIWISNQLSIPNVDNALLAELSSQFQNSDTTIADDILIPLPIDFKDGESSILQNPPPRVEGVEEWGVQKVRSSEAHYLIRSMEITPSPVTVGVVDTGVRRSHEALRSSYYGTYGWFDPYELTETPNDGNGHGTHVTGTIMGTKGIGVASPTITKWMACKGCSAMACSATALLLCGQYITCPTLANMSTPDCGRAPDIVSNSWGSTVGGQTWFDVVIDAWHAAGIIPVFSAGNAGPGCGTVGSPGDKDVISVGSTDVADAISWFSSRGPTVYNATLMKPEFSAPGHFVLSSTNASDTSYEIYSGTSMACPHVTGVIAILKSVRPSLTYAEVQAWLTAGVDTASLVFQNTTCGGIPDNVFPNFVYGRGRVNAFKSLTQLLTVGPPTTTTPTTTTEQGSGVAIKAGPCFLVMLFILQQISKLSFQ